MRSVCTVFACLTANPQLGGCIAHQVDFSIVLSLISKFHFYMHMFNQATVLACTQHSLYASAHMPFSRVACPGWLCATVMQTLTNDV